MRPEPGYRLIPTGLAFDFAHFHFGVGERLLGLELVSGAFWISDDIIADPVIEPALTVRNLHERTDLIPRHHFQIVSKTRDAENVIKLGRQFSAGVGRRI